LDEGTQRVGRIRFELWQNFELEVISLVEAKLQKRAIAWQDLLDVEGALPQSTIVDVWKDWTMEDTIYNATLAGHDVVVSACWYLDHLNEGWNQFYMCDPVGLENLTDDQRSHVLGGHASMWGETVDQNNFFERVWPRASATAEILWAGGMSNETNMDLVADRLERFRCWLVQQFDVAAGPIGPNYCEFRPRIVPLATPEVMFQSAPMLILPTIRRRGLALVGTSVATMYALLFLALAGIGWFLHKGYSPLGLSKYHFRKSD
jgi:Glycosyl hydrolase family 20, catalytic domain